MQTGPQNILLVCKLYMVINFRVLLDNLKNLSTKDHTDTKVH